MGKFSISRMGCGASAHHVDADQKQSPGPVVPAVKEPEQQQAMAVGLANNYDAKPSVAIEFSNDQYQQQAAIRIQSHARGMQARGEQRKKTAVRSEASAEEQTFAAVGTEQQRAQAAVKLQSRTRGMLDRTKVEKRKASPGSTDTHATGSLQAAPVSLEEAAAIRIQSRARGMSERNRVERELWYRRKSARPTLGGGDWFLTMTQQPSDKVLLPPLDVRKPTTVSCSSCGEDGSDGAIFDHAICHAGCCYRCSVPQSGSTLEPSSPVGSPTASGG